MGARTPGCTSVSMRDVTAGASWAGRRKPPLHCREPGEVPQPEPSAAAPTLGGSAPVAHPDLGRGHVCEVSPEPPVLAGAVQR